MISHQNAALIGWFVLACIEISWVGFGGAEQRCFVKKMAESTMPCRSHQVKVAYSWPTLRFWSNNSDQISVNRINRPLWNLCFKICM